jgi:hypothetical protein
MCVSTINGEINNHMIQEKEPTRNEAIFGMDDSAVILKIAFVTRTCEIIPALAEGQNRRRYSR